MSYSETPFQRCKPNRLVIAEHRRRKALNQHLVKIRISASEIEAGETIQSAIGTSFRTFSYDDAR